MAAPERPYRYPSFDDWLMEEKVVYSDPFGTSSQWKEAMRVVFRVARETVEPDPFVQWMLENELDPSSEYALLYRKCWEAGAAEQEKRNGGRTDGQALEV